MRAAMVIIAESENRTLGIVPLAAAAAALAMAVAVAAIVAHNGDAVEPAHRPSRTNIIRSDRGRC